MTKHTSLWGHSYSNYHNKFKRKKLKVLSFVLSYQQITSQLQIKIFLCLTCQSRARIWQMSKLTSALQRSGDKAHSPSRFTINASDAHWERLGVWPLRTVGSLYICFPYFLLIIYHSPKKIARKSPEINNPCVLNNILSHCYSSCLLIASYHCYLCLSYQWYFTTSMHILDKKAYSSEGCFRPPLGVSEHMAMERGIPLLWGSRGWTGKPKQKYAVKDRY